MSTNKSLFTVDISNKLGKEYKEMFEVLMYQVTIQTAIQYMMYISNPSMTYFINGDFISFILFLISGILFYYLVIKKVLSFV